MGDFSRSYREELAGYRRDYPLRKMQLARGEVQYIFAGPAESRHTLILLNGGMDCHEMWMRYVKELSKDYQVLSFDFPFGYNTLQDLCGAIHELLSKLGIRKGIFIGASLGGLIAQIFALQYPGETEALVLMSTAGFTEGTLKKYGAALKILTPLMGLMKILPYSWFIRAEKKMMNHYIKEADTESRTYFGDMFDQIYETYSREKDLHVTGLQKDLENQRLTEKSDYSFLKGRVLLLLPEDDSEFPKQAQEELKREMTDPVIIPGIHGGHLMTMLFYKENIRHIRDFIGRLDEG